MIDWKSVKYFNPSVDKFSESPDLYAEPRLIYTLDRFREFVDAPIYPSPAPGALARFEGSKTTRHYAVGRLSDAIDVFCNANAMYVWLRALTFGKWGGIGIYPHTHYNGKSWVMFHLDLRPGPSIIWLRTKDGQYLYPLKSKFARETLTQELTAIV